LPAPAELPVVTKVTMRFSPNLWTWLFHGMGSESSWPISFFSQSSSRYGSRCPTRELRKVSSSFFQYFDSTNPFFFSSFLSFSSWNLISKLTTVISSAHRSLRRKTKLLRWTCLGRERSANESPTSPSCQSSYRFGWPCQTREKNQVKTRDRTRDKTRDRIRD